MKQFFKYVFATIVGVVISFFICFFLAIVIIAGIASGIKENLTDIQEGGNVDVKANSVLHIKLDYPIKERTPNNPFENFDFTNFEPKAQIGLNDILKNIEKAKADDNIKGIYLDLSLLSAGSSSVEEIRNALLDFKSSGKFIYTYSEILTQSAYYLASVSDKIFVNPNGLMEYKGFSMKSLYLKSMLEKLDIEPQIFVVGKFKSAIEIFSRDDMSEPAKKQLNVFLGDMYSTFKTNISASRGVSVAKLDSIAQYFLIREPVDAVKHHLIDATAYEDEVFANIKTQLGINTEEEIEFIALKKYVKTADSDREFGVKDKIAIIYAEGEIISGKGEDGQIGSESMVQAIREARDEEDVKVIVLRVNSPGGSALASDVIWRELVLAKKEKPLVVSMGDLAASGGYYISCMADSIVAQPNTITGSIGVFGVVMNAEGFYNKKLGINFDGVKTNPHADLGYTALGTRGLTEEEKMIVQNQVEIIYNTFLDKVAKGRNTTTENIHEIAQGRIWSGTRAQTIGLVDKLGGIEDALAIASRMANLEKYKVEAYPKRKDPFEKIIEGFGVNAKKYLLEQAIGTEYKYYKIAVQLKNYNGIQARIPFQLEIN